MKHWRFQAMMTNSEKRARKMFRELLAHYGGDLRKLETALWRVVQNGGGKLPTINTAQQRTGSPLRPYRTPEVA
jgi:hypothetical protein